MESLQKNQSCVAVIVFLSSHPVAQHLLQSLLRGPDPQAGNQSSISLVIRNTPNIYKCLLLEYRTIQHLF